MPDLLPLVIFLVSLFFFVGGYYFSAVFYYKKHSVKYSIKNMFPYEFNYPSAFKNNVYGNIAFIIALCSAMAFYIYNLMNSGAINVTNVVLLVFAISLAGLIACLLFMPLRYLRTHMIISTLAMVLAMGMPALGSFIAIERLRLVTDGVNKALCIIALVVGVVLATTMLIFVFNPKATYKIYLEKATDEKGNEVTVRPKSIPMAFNEWWSIITYLLSPLALVIISFIK